MNEEFYLVLIRTIFFNISTSYAFVKAKKREKINQRILIILMLINIILALLYSIFYTKTNNQYINKSITRNKNQQTNIIYFKHKKQKLA